MEDKNYTTEDTVKRLNTLIALQRRTNRLVLDLCVGFALCILLAVFLPILISAFINS